MNGYERALRTLRFEKTDCTPTFGGWVVSPGFFEYVTGKQFWEAPFSIACEAYRKLQVDIVFQCFYLPVSRDEWRREAVSEELSDQGRYRAPEDVVSFVASLKVPEKLESEYEFDRQLKNALLQYQAIQSELGDGIFCMPDGACTRFAWFPKFGYENYLMALALYPQEMKKLFEHAGEVARLHNRVLAELVRQKAIPPFFFHGTDICGNLGPIVAPEVLREIYFPCLRHSLQPLVEIGAEIVWHCDGYILPILDDLISCGVSGFQGFQEATGFRVGEIARKKVKSGRKPLLFAGLAVDKVLPFGTIDDVKSEIVRILREAAGGGGLVLGTANTAGPDCPNENLETLYTYVHAYGRGDPG